MYKLDKPFTLQERADFVSAHQGMLYAETDSAIYMMEPYEALQDGAVVDVSQSEEYIENVLLTTASAVISNRATLLASSDWTQTVDAPLTKDNKLEWQTYRQALRDITAQSGYPTGIVWPVAPAVPKSTDVVSQRTALNNG